MRSAAQKRSLKACRRSYSSGYFRDAETGNDYAVNRYMTPSSGRFITPDPSGLRAVNPANPQSWNMYA